MSDVKDEIEKKMNEGRIVQQLLDEAETTLERLPFESPSRLFRILAKAPLPPSQFERDWKEQKRKRKEQEREGLQPVHDIPTALVSSTNVNAETSTSYTHVHKTSTMTNSVVEPKSKRPRFTNEQMERALAREPIRVNFFPRYERKSKYDLDDTLSQISYHSTKSYRRFDDDFYSTSSASLPSIKSRKSNLHAQQKEKQEPVQQKKEKEPPREVAVEKKVENLDDDDALSLNTQQMLLEEDLHSPLIERPIDEPLIQQQPTVVVEEEEEEEDKAAKMKVQEEQGKDETEEPSMDASNDNDYFDGGADFDLLSPPSSALRSPLPNQPSLTASDSTQQQQQQQQEQEELQEGIQKLRTGPRVIPGDTIVRRLMRERASESKDLIPIAKTKKLFESYIGMDKHVGGPAAHYSRITSLYFDTICHTLKRYKENQDEDQDTVTEKDVIFLMQQQGLINEKTSFESLIHKLPREYSELVSQSALAYNELYPPSLVSDYGSVTSEGASSSSSSNRRGARSRNSDSGYIDDSDSNYISENGVDEDD
ncbi:hypothetical protein BDF20DRAFT_913020 [Mycotypha africana]|uniref:uncharacterized protein n=1 Tax=Mycotypha africana TaxID=64632 RepID=UPI0023013859|nr:uncharacterized protein BDF20DRAFT_913020 [Mycotypha africana]KAI8979441.1 hypothetical protein BDF20DRAFT_913020 [Mycotypha africana]